MEIKDLMILGKSISDASNNAEEIRSITHHNAMMRGYEKEIAGHQLRAVEAVGKQALEKEKAQASAMERQASFYRGLLFKPFSEISKHCTPFANNYYIFEQTLSDWVLSQKSFKELAYDLGNKLGYSEEMIDELYLNRVDEIASGSNPNEVMPERFAAQVINSQENLKLSIQQKKTLLDSYSNEENSALNDGADVE